MEFVEFPKVGLTCEGLGNIERICSDENCGYVRMFIVAFTLEVAT